jgi:hypothetical protein
MVTFFVDHPKVRGCGGWFAGWHPAIQQRATLGYVADAPNYWTK